MNYQAVEESIAEQLSSLSSVGISSAVLPDVQADYKTPIGPTAWVSYVESSFEAVNLTPTHFSIGPTIQNEVLNFEMTIQAKKLRGDAGIYKVIELVRRKLLGFAPTNCHKLYLVKVIPEQFAENLYTYKLLMACSSVAMEDFEEEGGVLITRIQLDDKEPFTDTTVSQ